MRRMDGGEIRSEEPSANGLDRRTLLTRIGVGAGVAWIAPAIVSSPAFAQSGTCIPEAVDWTNHQTGIDDLDNNSFDVGLGSNSTLTVSYNEAGLGGGTATPVYAQPQPLGNRFGGYITLSMDATAQGEFVELELVFDNPIQNLQFTLIDVDRGLGFWQDEVHLEADLGGVPVVLGPTDYTIVNPALITANTTLTTNEFVATVDPSGTGLGVANTSTDGDIAVNYPGQIDRLRIRYYAGSATDLETQQIGIDGLQFCLYDT